MKFNNIVLDSYLIEKKILQSTGGPKKEAKAVVLQSVGYPFLCNLVENPKIEIVDKDLFELYAIEQWEGYTVVEGSFLFDQKLLPDFAFKIIKAHPNNSRITSNTSILLMKNDKEKEVKKIESGFKMTDVIDRNALKESVK